MTGTNPRDEGLKPRSRRTWNSGFQVQLCSRYSKPHRYATLPGVRTETSKHKRLWLFNAMIFLAELGEVKFGSNITIIYVGLLGYYQNIHIYIFGLYVCFCFLFDFFLYPVSVKTTKKLSLYFLVTYLIQGKVYAYLKPAMYGSWTGILWTNIYRNLWDVYTVYIWSARAQMQSFKSS